MHEVTVRKARLSVSVEDSANSAQLIGHDWDYSGVSRALGSKPNVQQKLGQSILISELRAGIDNGNIGGWVIYDMDGRALETMTP